MKRKREHPNIRAGRTCINTQLRRQLEGIKHLVPKYKTPTFETLGDMLDYQREHGITTGVQSK